MTPHERAQFVCDLLADARDGDFASFSERIVGLDREAMAEVLTVAMGVVTFLFGFLSQDPENLQQDINMQLLLMAEVEDDR